MQFPQYKEIEHQEIVMSTLEYSINLLHVYPTMSVQAGIKRVPPCDILL